MDNHGTGSCFYLLSQATVTSPTIQLFQLGAGKSIDISHSNTGAYDGIDLVYAGSTNALNITSSNTGSSYGVSISQASNQAALYVTKSGVMDSVYISSSVNSATYITGIEFNLINTGAGLEYAFDFEGSEQVAAAVGGSQDRKIRIRIFGTTYYIPCYTA